MLPMRIHWDNKHVKLSFGENPKTDINLTFEEVNILRVALDQAFKHHIANPIEEDIKTIVGN